MTREEIQENAVTALVENSGGSIHCNTGVGKGKIFIDYLMRVCKPYDSVIITVPLTTLIKMWAEEFNKWTHCTYDPVGDFLTVVIPNGYITVKIATIHSIYKSACFPTVHCMDEIHTQLTTEFSSVLTNVTCKYRVGLTATPDILRREDKDLLYRSHCPIVFEYLDGEEDGLVNKTQFKVIEHKLDNVFKVYVGPQGRQWLTGEAKQYDFLTSQLYKAELALAEAGSSSFFTDSQNWYWKKKGDNAQKELGRKYLTAITNRRKFLLSLQSSAEIAKRLGKQIVSENDHNKVLIFSEESNQLKKICQHNIYGEQLPKTLNDEVLEGFNSGKIRAVGSCYMLTMGMNLINVNSAIVETYNGSDTKATQRFGRLHRLAKDKVATIYLIKILGTQSEEWLNNMMKEYDLKEAEVISSNLILK